MLYLNNSIKKKIKKRNLSKKINKKYIKNGGVLTKSQCEKLYKEEFFKKVAIGNFEAVSALLEICPSLVHIKNDFEIDYNPEYNCATMMTPLYYAVSRNMTSLPFINQFFPPNQTAKDSYYQIAELLIAKGADVNMTTPVWFKGWAPIHWAAEYGNIDMINLLKKNKANVKLKYQFPDGSKINLRQIAEMRIVPNILKNYNPLLDSISSDSPTNKLPTDLPKYRRN